MLPSDEYIRLLLVINELVAMSVFSTSCVCCAVHKYFAWSKNMSQLIMMKPADGRSLRPTANDNISRRNLFIFGRTRNMRFVKYNIATS